MDKSENRPPEETRQSHLFPETGSQDRVESRAQSYGSEGNEKKKISPPTRKTYITIAVAFAGYILLNIVGAVIFQAIEKKKTDGTIHPITVAKSEFVRMHGENLTVQALNEFLQQLEDIRYDLNEETIAANVTLFADDWTLNQGFLLSFTIASTIGYGILTPRTDGGQIFAIFYALVSIPFTGLLAAKLGSVLAYFIKKAGTFIFKGRKSNRWIKIASILFTFLVGLFIYIIIPAFVLAYVDSGEKWTFVESLYCIFITLTTIGFGDYVPDPHASLGMAGNILVLIWVVAGLAWAATIVNLIATVISKQATSIKKKVANQHITIKTLKSGAAVLGGHKSSKKFKIKPSSDSLEKGSGKYSTESAGTFGENSVAGSREDLNLQNNEIFEGEDKTSSSPTSVVTADSRRESKSLKKDDNALGPSGLMSVVINNMESYTSDVVEEGESHP